MPVHIGRINCRDFAQFLHDKLIEAGYQEISSSISNDGRVYKSLGESGQDEFYVRMSDPVNNYLTFGIYDKYTPNNTPGLSGTFGVGYVTDSVTWNSSINSERHDIDYVVVINKDRLIIFVEGMKAESNNCHSLTYIGLPKRYDANDKGANAAGITGTTRMPWHNNNTFRIIRNRANDTLLDYTLAYYPNARSFGWGNKLFFSPIFVGNSDEGVRGELIGLYSCEPINFEDEAFHRDIISKDGKNYMIIDPYPVYNTSDTLLQDRTYLIEI